MENISNEKKEITQSATGKDRLLRIGSSIVWTIFGITSVIRYMKTGDEFLLWTGLFIGVAHLGTAIFWAFFAKSK